MKVWAFEGFEDNELPDGQIADRAISVLDQLYLNRSHGDYRPFFLAVGFHKPHLPFYAPAKYYDLYPPVSEIKLAENPDAPKDMPDIAWSTARIERYKDISKVLPNVSECKTNPDISIHGKDCRFPDEKAQELRRAYYACISYTDAQVGRDVVCGSLQPERKVDNLHGFCSDIADQGH